MKKILITGAAGFVGRQFQRYFADIDDVELILIDLKYGIDCRDFFKIADDPYDLVIHLAAIVGGRETIEGQPLSVATDLAIDSDMFNWAVRTHQPRVVYYSSSAAYPIALQNNVMKLYEDHINLNNIRLPDYSYGWSKLTGEMLATYAKQEGVNIHVFRPFSGYGEDQDLVYPFPSFIRRAKQRENPFEIWGSGNQVRDFIHIEDVVNATMAVVDLDIQEPINLGWGRPTSFIELCQVATNAIGYQPEIKLLKDKPEGVFYRCSDNSKMLQYYTPKISLEEGIRRALAV